MNKIIISGNVGKDAEERFSENGKKSVIFTFASSKKVKDEFVPTWFTCVCPGENSFALKFAKKGASLIVTGTLDTPRTYRKDNGEYTTALTIFVHHVEFAPGGKAVENTERGRVTEETKYKQDELPF